MLRKPAVEPVAASEPATGDHAWFSKAIIALSGGYAVLILVVMTLMWSLGDRWWPATVLLLMPRVAWLLPLIVLALATSFSRRIRVRAWLFQAVTAGVVLGPLMGLHVPVGTSGAANQAAGVKLRLMTLNRASRSTDPATIAAFVEREGIDVICFQETRGVEAVPGFLPGWFSDPTGSIYSRFPIVKSWEPSDPNDFPEIGFWPVQHSRAMIELENGEQAVIGSAHMPTPTSGLSLYLSGDRARAARYLEWRWTQLGVLSAVLTETRSQPTVFGCDLNTTADSPLFGLLRIGYRVAFEEAGRGYGYTRPARFPWAGIDHILVSDSWKVLSCRVGPDLGSDHRPMIAELVLPAGSGTLRDD